MSDPGLVELVAAVVIALGGGGGAVHIAHRRRANGIASPSSDAQQEVLRQSLHEARHGETLRILGEVSETSASAAVAAQQAAAASERSAHMTERMATTLDERLPRASGS